MSQNEVLCRCLNVTRQEVEQAIDVFAASTEKEVGRLTEAGTGCMCCRRCIRDLIREKQQQSAVLRTA